MRSMMTLGEACALAVLSGLIAHQYYKRWEPTLLRYLTELLALEILGFLLLFRQTRVVTTSLLLSFACTGLHLFTLGLSIAIYRLYLHPLKKYPGPPLAKLTKWYGFYLTTFRKTHITYPELHKQYGDVVRIGPNELSFADPDSVKQIHGIDASRLGKGPNYDARLWANDISMGDERDIQTHRARRRAWEKGLSSKAIASYEPRLIRVIDMLKSKFASYVDKEINVGGFIDFFGFDAMSELAFDETYGFLEAESSGDLADFVRKGLKMTEYMRNVQWLTPVFNYIPMKAEDREKTISFQKVSVQQFEKRLAKGTKPTDLFSYLLADGESGGNHLTKSQLAADSPVIIVAGSDTTGVCLSFVFYFMTKDPRVQKKLIEEIDKAWATYGEDLDGAKLGPDKMPYLHGVINESLRMVPPAPGGNQRTIPKGGCVINGEFLPENTQVHSQPTFMAHDPRSFTYPERFFPERWNDELRDPTWNHDIRSFIPFTAGQFICPGKALAYLEMRLLLTRVLKDFEFEMALDFDHAGFWLGLESYMGFQKPPIPLAVRRRQKEMIAN